MSYHSSAQRVLNPKFTPGYRAKALNSCISELSFRIKPSYAELCGKYLPWGLEPPTEEMLIESYAQIEALRNEYLRRRLAYRQMRILEKQRGNRYPREADLAFIGDILLPKD